MTTNVRLRADLHEQLKRIAEREHRSLNAEINHVLEEFARAYVTEHPDVAESEAE